MNTALKSVNKKIIYNYYCTWTSQKTWNCSVNPDAITAQDMRDRLGSEFLFGEKGVLNFHPECIRQDMLVVLDDGWDVAKGVTHEKDSDNASFGSLIPDAGKFPEIAGLAPYERLKALSQKVKELGYAGLGLWVPSNYFGEDVSEDYEERLKKAGAFWEERGKMCSYADIKYLKVDWGYHGRDIRYRSLMTEAVKKHSPSTLIEHVVGIFDMPYDPEPDKQESPEFLSFLDTAKRTFLVSDVYRTYDVVEKLSTATTLMRISKLFDVGAAAGDGLAGIINVEDDVTVAAALGMSAGIMRDPCGPYYGDVTKALVWQRFSPPWRLEAENCFHSDELLCDSYFFDSPEGVWPYVGQKTIKQYAPSCISRGVPLPDVDVSPHVNGKNSENGERAEKPFVLASKNPDTLAYTVASLPRTAENKYKYRVPAKVTVKEAELTAPIGIFGTFEKLDIQFTEDLNNIRVFARDMLSEECFSDITNEVSYSRDTLTIDGKLLEKTAAKGADGDISENAVIIKLERI